VTRTRERKIVLVTRRTRLDDLLYRYNTVEQARFHVESLGADFEDYLDEDRTYKQQIAIAERTLARLGRVHPLERSFLPNFIFGDDDLVVVIGQDGLVANTLKYVPGRPVIAVNPDPRRYDGILLPFEVNDVYAISQEVMTKGRPVQAITMAEASLSDGQRLLAVNDLFIGPASHTSARYELRLGDKVEQQSSSGVIVSTGLGSTGWLKSIMAGTIGVARALGVAIPPERKVDGFAWDSEYLYYTVREPFPSVTSTTELVFGKVTNRRVLRITSAMPQGGVIFSDGLIEDAVSFNAGLTVQIEAAKEKCLLVN